ncbi:MAG TPA: hypothetical protein VM146_15395 [Steroidobacteraceae bacterium]|nr:hypothetical protein [Steroidobacteraceae bacterium]
MLMMLAETCNGFLREVFVAPSIGALRARQLGVLLGSSMVLLIAAACARWVGAGTRRQQIALGAFWVVLTLAFELALGRALNISWPLLLSDYNPAQGGFMLFGLAVIFAAPMLVSRWATSKIR